MTLRTHECTNYQEYVGEINWDMIQEDAVTMYLEWGNNNHHDPYRPPVTNHGEYSIYLVVDTWEEPKVVMNKMNNWGAEALCEFPLPENLAQDFLEHVGHLRGVHELTPELKVWIRTQLDIQ